jgi:tetratricopeptide (TPR) repeat protein
LNTVARNPLNEADRLLKRRRWVDVITLLEPLAPMYRENASFSVMLGMAYLHRDDIGGAYSCFRRVQNLDFKNRLGLIGLAAVFLRRNETDKAVQLYLEILERNPRDTLARKALNLVRRKADKDGLASDGLKLKALYPLPPTRILPPILIICGLLLVTLAFVALPRIKQLVDLARPVRAGIVGIVLTADEKNNPVGSSGGFEIVLTQQQALAAFDTAKRFFAEYRDEAALVEVNRLLLSNATRSVKSKAEALARYAREPTFQTMPDRFAYSDVLRFPRLYEGVGVAWKGLAANLESSNGSARFDLLVGYHDKRRLDGIVAVHAPFEVRISPDRPVEVLAKVRSSADGFSLECIAIHEQ